MSDAFWNGLWSGIFELIALGLIAGWINLIYQRIRSRQSLRHDLINDIDAFSAALYKPRKMYQHLIKAQSDSRSTTIQESDDEPIEQAPELAAFRLRHVCLDEFTAAAGQFRAIQVKMVPLFGFDVELFAYYLSVWNAVRAVRKRMERGVDLYEAHETEASSDALYRLLDQFRYRVQVTRSVKDKPRLLRPPSEVEEQIRARSKEITQEFMRSNINSQRA